MRLLIFCLMCVVVRITGGMNQDVNNTRTVNNEQGRDDQTLTTVKQVINSTDDDYNDISIPDFHLEDIRNANITGLTGDQCKNKLLMLTRTPSEVEIVLCRCFHFCKNDSKEEQQIALIGLKKSVAQRDNYDDIVVAASYSFVMLVGTLGNLLVLVTIFKVFKTSSVTNLFISSLAFADLLVVLICIPFRVIDYVGTQVWSLGEETCKFFYYMFFATFMASVFTLTAMSMERYLVICHPMKAASMSTTSRARKIIVAAWITALSMAIPSIFVSGIRGLECDVFTADKISWYGPFFLYLLFVLYLVPCIVMGFAYGRTGLALWRSIRTANSMTSTGKESSDSKARLQVIKMLVAVWILFAVTWGCYLMFYIFDAYAVVSGKIDANGHAMTVINQVISLLTMANSAINPILYAFMSSQFRKGFIRCLSCVPIIKRKYLQPTTVSYATSSTGVYSVPTTAKPSS